MKTGKFFFTSGIIALIFIIVLNVTGCCTTFSPVSSAKTIHGGSYLYVDVSVQKSILDDIPILGSGNERKVTMKIEFTPADAKIAPLLLLGDNMDKYHAGQNYTIERFDGKTAISSGFTDQFTIFTDQKTFIVIKNLGANPVNVTVTLSPA